MSIELAGGASTQSRAWRPLPPGAVCGTTLAERGATETVRFDFEDGHHERRDLLSWVGGQWGGLFGASPDLSELPFDAVHLRETHGSYGHAAEHDLAAALGEVYDGLLTSDDMACRFYQDGGTACAAAVRIARAETGRDAIATQGYHGMHADFAHEPAWTGYPYENVRLHHRFDFGDTRAMRNAARRASCVMVEVPAWDDEAAIAEFLQACRDTADEFGVPFIIDDVVLGFRVALGGTCERYGVRADMVCLGKTMSATGCVSALIGRADLVGKLDGEVFASTTFGGAPGPCSVAAATVRWLAAHRGEVYGGEVIDMTALGDAHPQFISKENGHLRIIGDALKDGLNALGVRCVGQPERFITSFYGEADHRAWCSKMIGRDILVDRPFFSTLAHTPQHVEETLAAAEAIHDMQI